MPHNPDWTRRDFLRASAGATLGGALTLGRAARAQDGGSDDQPWVILVTIDTLRADHCGCYGYPRNTTPFLDRMAQEGTRFERCYTTIGTTYPAHTAMMTGLHLPQHGVVNNRSAVFEEEAATLAGQYKAMGYRTAAFVSAPFLYKLQAGFDHLDNDAPEDLPYRWSENTVRAAMDYLEKQPSNAPQFIWVHVFDPHEWMRADEPQGDLESMAVESDTEREALFEYWTKYQAKFVKADEHSLSALRHGNKNYFIEKQLIYDSRIRYTDEWLAQLFDAIETARSSSEAIYLWTADHGEALGNHQYDQHGRYLYNHILQVPLIAYATDGAWQGMAKSEPVSHIDIWSTLAARTGVEPGAEQPRRFGVNLFDAEAEATLFAGRQVFGHRLVKHPNHTTAAPWIEDPVYCIQDAQYKYIFNGGDDDELYDLQRDPREMLNIVKDQEALAAKLKADAAKAKEELLANRLARATEGDGTDAPSEDEELLRALGYL